MDFELTTHARHVAREREIALDWIERALDHPDRVETPPDGTTHYLRSIDEFEGRMLRVVVNAVASPLRVVTVFFDRRERRTP